MDFASTAISIVGFCIEFGEFARKAYRIGQEIHHSADGATEDNAQIERLVEESMAFNKKLNSSIRRDVKSIADMDFEVLYTEFVKESENLLKSLRALKPSSSGSKKLIKIRAVLANYWQSEKIEKAKAKVDNLDSQLVQRLNVIQDMQNQEANFPENDIVHNGNVRTKQSQIETAKVKQLLARLPPEALQDKEFESLVDQLLRVRVSTQDHDNEQKIVSTLWYTDYHARTMKMAGDEEAKFHSSCQWVHSSEAFAATSNDDFSAWLRTGDGMYWITGKAGAGKSVLMNFIVNSPQTRFDLESWAGDSKLVLASFFFWYHGPTTEQSHHGLLRSLFYEIANANPALTRKLFPARWKALQSGAPLQEKISETELEEAVRNLVDLDDDNFSFCLFIDGLDEFVGNRPALLDSIRRMTSGKHVKICVSSRQWTEFSEYFEQDPSLRVHEMTRDNMRSYIKQKLESKPRWMKLVSRDSEATTSLVDQIVNKAEGVFLWVRYVIKRLTLKINEFMDIKQFESEVNKFPPDLTAYFRDMLQRLDSEEDFQIESRKIFLVALSSPVPLIGLVYSFLAKSTAQDKGRYTWAKHKQKLNDKDLRLRSDSVAYWVGRHCQDLLEVYVENGSQREIVTTSTSHRKRLTHGKVSNDERLVEYVTKVDFLHRSARDYLETAEGQELVKLKLVFDSPDYILQASLTLLKSQSSGMRKTNRRDALESIMRPILSIISNQAMVDQEPNVIFLDELDKAGFQCLDYSGRVSTKYWTERLDQDCRNFLCLAVVLSLRNYVRSKLNRKTDEDNQISKEELLLLALQYPYSTKPLMGRYQTIEVILDAGAVPAEEHFVAWTRLKRIATQNEENALDSEARIEDLLAAAGYVAPASNTDSSDDPDDYSEDSTED